MSAAPDFDKEYAKAAPRNIDLSSYGAERFKGPPPPIKWLVEGCIPEGVAALLAAMGEVGKSYKSLELCCQVAFPEKPATFKVNGTVIQLHAPPVLGGRVVSHGTAVFVTAEDTEAAIHRRLTAIDPFERRQQYPSRLRIVALPDAGGPMPFFTIDHNGVVETPEWRMMCDQLSKVPDLKLVSFDPLANFAQVGLDSDNCHAQHVTSRLASSPP
jgi:RecA-family ATPase